VTKVRLGAVDRALRIAARRAALLGLDAPVTLAGVDLTRLTDDQLLRLGRGESTYAVLATTPEPAPLQIVPPFPPDEEDDPDADIEYDAVADEATL